MVRGDDVDRAVGERGAQCVDVFAAAQGRIHLEQRVVPRHQVLRQQQVVRGDLGRHPDAACLAQRITSTDPAVDR